MLQQQPMYAYIPAKDVARARQFYEQKLGFKPAQEVAGGVVYKFGQGTACFLYPTPNAGTSKASQAFWQVDDVEREVAELKKRGVTFEEYDVPGMKTSRSHRTRAAAAGGRGGAPRPARRHGATPALRHEGVRARPGRSAATCAHGYSTPAALR